MYAGVGSGGGGARGGHLPPLTPPEKSHGYYSIYVPFLNALPNIGKKVKRVVCLAIEKQP